MATSQGNGGRTSGATVAQIPGFSDDDNAFVPATKGRKAAVIPNLEAAMLQMLRAGKGTFTHEGDNAGRDLAFKTKASSICARWCKVLELPEGKISPEFSVADKADDGKITRKVRLVVDSDTRKALENRLSEIGA